jgi:methyl-accepting chemotaxis protein
VTQQNAALVEQVTAATLSFEEEAKRLTASVGRFKFASRAGTRPAAAAARPAPAQRQDVRPLPASRAKPALAASGGEPDEWKEF